MNFAVCVFCGARDGTDERWRSHAQKFGRELARREMTLIYGGGNAGLMGHLADAALAGGGRAIGIIPDFLTDREVLHTGLTETHIVDDLLERKALMIENADAFVALPGGIGTYDEILEVITWRQLRQLRQPIALMNCDNYFGPFLDLLSHSIDAGFVRAGETDHVIVDTDPVTLLDALLEAPPP